MSARCDALYNSTAMKSSVIIRFIIVGAVWLGLCAILLARLIGSGRPVTMLSLFPIVASGVIVFVPLYKKYVRKRD